MKISYAKYELVPRSRSLNARDETSSAGGGRSGALLRVETNDGVGFADLHPWTEFGDLPLDEQLKSLSKKAPAPLAQRSLHFAAIDLSFRKQNQSAFAGLRIPANHFLLPGVFAAGADTLDALAEDGFKVVKIKCGRNLKAELQQFMHLMHAWPEELRLRLDFNASLSFADVDDYLKRLPRLIREKIEFVEDPCIFLVESWTELSKRHGVGLALDLEATNPVRIQQASQSNCVTHFIIKPAVQNADEIWSLATRSKAGVKFAMTSYLDHPLGQMSAAWTASQFAHLHPESLSECGLLSHIVYEPNEFSEMIETEGPLLRPTEGTGFGFDDLLRRQNWQELQ